MALGGFGIVGCVTALNLAQAWVDERREREEKQTAAEAADDFTRRGLEITDDSRTHEPTDERNAL